ncbi:IS630 family transposase [Deinococcus sp. SL84]|uniref:IS630 family transposase n=1 Tax=Deinococcus sp. SL84 TaxID=2994663 RepID=UPI0022738AF2|nr:IS630 family transposase [Deinococcus sp. SL84]MCY1703414.1 IS630 family transposase [Deinococcus sp. SL84]
MEWQPNQYSRAQLEERRLAATEWLQQGSHTHREIAAHFGVSVLTVNSWSARLRKKGSLQATVSSGRPARLTESQHDQLRTLLREGAKQHGFPDETWTTKRVAELIGRHFEVWYHHDHVRKILRKLGFSPQVLDGRAAERNELRIASWREQVLPELEKKVAEGATIIYLDEVGFSLKGVRRRTWSPRGVTPLVTLRANWEKLSTIGAITSDGRFFQHTKSGAIRSGEVIRFFRHLLRHVQGEIVVVLDNARIHHAKVTQAFVGSHERLSLIFLPPYAPELNPIELVWAYVKRNVLGNFCAHSIRALKKRLVTAWQRVRYIHLPRQLMDANLRRYQ